MRKHGQLKTHLPKNGYMRVSTCDGKQSVKVVLTNNWPFEKLTIVTDKGVRFTVSDERYRPAVPLHVWLVQWFEEGGNGWEVDWRASLYSKAKLLLQHL